jgi:hypothetical protein
MEPFTAMAVATAASTAVQVWSEAQAQAKQATSQKQAQRILQAAQAKIDALKPPNPEDQKLFFEQFQSAGQLNPTLEDKVSAGNSSMEGVSTDPALRQAQQNALAKLQQVGAEGLTAEDKFALSQIQSSNRQQERGSREAILQGMQRRGMGGSGNELMAKLQAQQSAADRNNMQGMQQASMAQQRALDAMMASGRMAGSMRDQDFGEKSKIAEARDVMSRFNANLMSGSNTRNTDRINTADASNLANKQAVMNANTNLSNSQQEYNKGLLQQNYQNQLNQATASGNLATGQAAQINGMGNTQANNNRRWGQVGTDAIAGAYRAYDSKGKKPSENDTAMNSNEDDKYKFYA